MLLLRVQSQHKYCKVLIYCTGTGTVYTVVLKLTKVWIMTIIIIQWIIVITGIPEIPGILGLIGVLHGLCTAVLTFRAAKIMRDQQEYCKY
jgi:uncharacterized membrane protein